jgi:hypothetical protein
VRYFENVGQVPHFFRSRSSRKPAAPLEAFDTAAALRGALDPGVGGVAVRTDVDDDRAPR